MAASADADAKAAGNPTRPRRRLLQFSLRGVVVLMLLAAVVLGRWSYWHHRIRKQRVAREEIAALQDRLTKQPQFWINGPVTGSVNRTPWWLRADGEKTIPVTTGVSFDLMSYDDGFPQPTGIRDRDLRMLAAFPYLYEVRVPRSDVGDDGLSWLKPLRRLRRLDLSHSDVDDDDLAALARLDDLQSLKLDGLQISGAGLAHLARCPKLTQLSLADVPLTAEGAAELNRLKALERLTVGSAMLARLDLRHLPNLTVLQIHLSGEHVDVQLEQLPKLRNLDVLLSQAKSPRRVRIVDLAALDQLKLHLPLLPQGAATSFELTLERLPQIDSIHWQGTPVGASFLPQVSRLTSLRHLIVHAESGWSAEALEPLTQLPRLRLLRLGPRGITDDCLRRIATIGTLEDLVLESPGISGEGIRELGALPRLGSLHLIGAAGDEDLGSTLAGIEGLAVLGLYQCQFPALRLGAEGGGGALPELRYVNIDDCDFPEVRFAGLSQLNHLSLDSPTARRIVVDDLARLQNLNLSLAAGQRVEQFTLKGLPELRWLSLQCGAEGAQVPADVFEHLHEFKNLRGGTIWGLDLPPEAKTQLQRFTADTGISF